MAQALTVPCRNVEQLRRWVELVCGIRVPVHPVCAGHEAPMAYLAGAYFEPARDLVVWAPRGGGKTRLGAAATLLDLLHKPGCQVRLLGGSLDQSLKMWEHLQDDVLRVASSLVHGRMTGRRVALLNGSRAAVLTQSQRAVRGVRVQKLRCDEVECFDPAVWDAAQLVTRSRPPAQGEAMIAGAIEAVSTWHRVGGVMERVIEDADPNRVRILRWCLMEVLEKCPPERECASCPLWQECRGRAKTQCEGFVSIEDAIAMKQRVSREMWQTEMLCRRPTRRSSVFPDFDETVHVGESPTTDGRLCLALDFGFANPFVCLWIWTDGQRHVVLDEYVQAMRTMTEHLDQMEARPWGAVKTIACDPAGAGRNEQTAESNIQMLRRRGYQVRYRKSLIVEGLELVRAALRPASGEPHLRIHPRCLRLIKALKAYRYAEGGSELPVKDGEHDHLIDALRYYFINQPPRGQATWRTY